ncbi:MAG: patatin-like phospholipase family protein [Candidatus Acidiferrales bacterium]
MPEQTQDVQSESAAKSSGHRQDQGAANEIHATAVGSGKANQEGERAWSFSEVFAEELADIEVSRNVRGQSNRPVSTDSDPKKRGAQSQLLGLAFSGGGIRSATFNLGVLQALAKLNLLPRIDYLSTVSGGGYIGSWLAAWLSRCNIADVFRELHPEWADEVEPESKQPAPQQEPSPVKFLREYSNYLTPRLGLFGADTWAAVATILRNLLLNLTILVLALTAVLLLPYAITLLSTWAMNWPSTCLVLSFCLVAMGIVFVGLNLGSFSPVAKKKYPGFASQAMIFVSIALPVFVGAWFASNWLGAGASVSQLEHFRMLAIAWTDLLHVSPTLDKYVWLPWLIWGAAVYFVIWFLGWLIDKVQVACFRKPEQASVNLNPQNWGRRLRTAPFAGATGGVLLWSEFQLLNSWTNPDIEPWRVAGLGTALMVIVFSLTVVAHIGFMGREFPDEKREWLARLGGLLLLAALVWTGLFGMAIYGPLLVMRAGVWSGSAAGVAWMASTISGILAGKSSSTGKKSTNWKLSIITTIAPYVFVVGLLLLLSFGVYVALAEIQAVPLARVLSPAHYWDLQCRNLDWKLFIWLCVTFLGALSLSSRVDINEFSMHMLYRNRLTRCYLGASHCGRGPQPFTGFDPEDDVLLHNLVPDKTNGKRPYYGPYPIINATLNLVKGEELAWQERKAASFIFTPRFSGFDVRPSKDGCHDIPVKSWLESNAYRRTERYGYKNGGPYLGTAMAISGAAASPNMGYYSSPALGFLMTVFNVRLGWWLGNPRHRDPYYWRSPGPRLGLFYLISELLGMTNDERGYVYLSDGGHFENLALYELVRRRCRFIIASDAGADREMQFGDLGNAIEKCRVDFGVDIEIDVENLRCDPTTMRSQWHCAIGRIRYDKVDRNVPPGVLLYLKPSLTGEEPADLLRYKAQNSDFPHQTTANQWFDESEFESYRALGQHVTEKAILPVAGKKELASIDVEELLVRLLKHWYPPSRFVQASFTKHTATYTALLDRMREDKNLYFLAAQVYPEWPELLHGSAQDDANPQYWLPDNEGERRAGFYFCNEVIQLFEDAYIDLNLEAEHDHPDNRGWMNLFLHWAWSGMFRATWAISAGIYGARFQRFCERHLDLGLGTATIGNREEIPDKADDLKKFLTNAEDKDILGFREIEIVGEFLKSCRPPDGQSLPRLFVLPFRMTVHSPRNANDIIEFNFGFALASFTASPQGKKTAEIAYFRIRNYVRKMGLARQALIALQENYKIKNAIPTASDEQIQDLRRAGRGESILEALPTLEAVLKFDRILHSIPPPLKADSATAD